VTPQEARRLGRAIHRRTNWIHEAMAGLRLAGEEGDELAERLHEALVDEQLGPATDVNGIVGIVLREWKEGQR
jgi:hypothetical protein